MLTLFRLNDAWLLERSGQTYYIQLTQTDTRFTGHDLDTDNPSTLFGDLRMMQGQLLISFTHSSSDRQQSTVYEGRLIRRDRIEGHWNDTVGGSGTFSLTCQPNLAESIKNARERAIASRELNNLDASNPNDDTILPVAGSAPADPNDEFFAKRLKQSRRSR